MSCIVKKGNVELFVDDSDVSKYLEKGYDQLDGKGKILKKATAGRSVSLAEYDRKVAELEGEIAKLKKSKKNADATSEK